MKEKRSGRNSWNEVRMETLEECRKTSLKAYLRKSFGRNLCKTSGEILGRILRKIFENISRGIFERISEFREVSIKDFLGGRPVMSQQKFVEELCNEFSGTIPGQVCEGITENSR